MNIASDLNPLLKNVRFTPEFRLVAACSWLPVSDHSLRQSDIIESLLNCKLNWSEVTPLVLRHGVVGQFCAVMGKRGWVNVPDEMRDHLKSYRTQQVARALAQVAALKRVGRLFSEAGIPLMPLKGVALSQGIYGDPCVRSSCDLDILVKRGDVERAEGVLTQAGYHHSLDFHEMHERQKRHIVDTLHHHEYVGDINNSSIELHWRSYLWSKEQVDVLWETSNHSGWLGIGLVELSTVENILFLADHGARHGWPNLKWLSDIAMLMESMHEEELHSLLGRAAFFDLQRVMCQTALLLRWFYGITLPEKYGECDLSGVTVTKLAVHAVSQLLASGDEIVSQGKRLIGPRMALQLKQLKPSTPLSALLRGVMITHADFVDFPLPDYLFWLYIPLRPYFWFKRHYLKR